MKIAKYKWNRSAYGWVVVDERKIIRAEITEHGERTHIEASLLGFGDVQILGTVKDAKALIEEHLGDGAVFTEEKPTPPGLLKVTGE